MWGYKPIPSARTPDEEKPVLDQWTKVQETTPWLRFSTAGAMGSDPGDLTEAVGDADAVKATALGLKNIERVAANLIPATEQRGENWNDLQRVYSRLLGQWAREMGHVAAIVGGADSQQLHGGQNGVRFKPVAKERQSEAVKFLLDNAFRVPKWALNPEVLRRIEPDGAISRFKQAQQALMAQLMSTARLNRMVEHEALEGAKAYAPAQFISDLRRGVFSELNAAKVQVDAFRRNTQRLFLDAANDRLNGRSAANDDIKALLRSELRALSADASRAMALASDRATRAHLEDVRDQIAKILDPKFAPPAPAAAAAAGFPRGAGEEDPSSLNCWPDYGIYPVREQEQ
jgi:hypothetical protein